MPERRRRITIIGLGLIGGSLGLALRAAGQGWEVVGHNRSHDAAGRARKLGAVDRAEWNLPAALEGAELVVIAVAPLAVEKILTEIAPLIGPGTIVTDVTSTKAEVIEWADRILPEGVHFVGGHPMAGKEAAGIDAADAALFRGATWCILPGRRCAPEAVGRVEAIVRAVGAVPYYLDAAEHDSYVAAVSHVPFVAAAALVASAAGSPSWRDMQRLAAGGFRDTTRTASGDVAMHRDICLTNRDSIARWLDGYIAELARARDLVLHAAESDADREALEDFFVQAKVARDKWIETRGEPSADLPIVPMPESRSGLSDMLFGRRRRSE